MSLENWAAIAGVVAAACACMIVVIALTPRSDYEDDLDDQDEDGCKK